MQQPRQLGLRPQERERAPVQREQLVQQRGRISDILKVQSLNPEAMADHLELYMTLMFGKSGLDRMERESIAVVVSATNECDYCVAHHLEVLRRYVDDDETMLAACQIALVII